MVPQYLADHTLRNASFESFETQPPHFDRDGCICPACSASVTGGNVTVTGTSCRRRVGHFGVSPSGIFNRRKRCQRASRACWPFAWSPLWRLARRSKKNSLSFSPSRFRRSQAIPANTSKIISGPATGQTLLSASFPGSGVRPVVPGQGICRVRLNREGAPC